MNAKETVCLKVNHFETASVHLNVMEAKKGVAMLAEATVSEGALEGGWKRAETLLEQATFK